MSVRSKLIRQAERAESKADRLRARGGARQELRADSLDARASENWDTLETWESDRWGGGLDRSWDESREPTSLADLYRV
jgi:hypothetical protein